VVGRKRWGFVVAAALALTFVACGESSSNDEETADTVANTPPSTTVAPTTSAPPVRSAPDPADFVRQQSGPYWVWFGPPDWIGSGGTYGITIQGGDGATLDYGFSSAICTAGANWEESVTNYYAAVHQYLRGNGYEITGTSPITRPDGSSEYYRRQDVTFRLNQGGVVKEGLLTFDYDFTSATAETYYCFTRNLGIYANQDEWAALRPILVQVQNSLAYSGPGGCDPNPGAPC
jgi:hypothetical protein